MATDTFTNDNNTALNTHDAKWDSGDEGGVGDLEIYNNMCRKVAASDWNDETALYNDSQDEDQECQFDLVTNGSADSNTPQPCVRMGGATRGYSANLYNADTGNWTRFQLLKDEVLLGDYATVSVAISSSPTVKITASGNASVTVTGYIDGSQEVQEVDSSSTITGGNPGFWFKGEGDNERYSIDNWSDNISAGGSVPVLAMHAARQRNG